MTSLGDYPDTRAGDLRFLEMLDVVVTQRSSVAQGRYGLTRGQVAGLRTRYSRPDPKNPDQCRRKANRDGGMLPRWWAQ